MSRAIEDQSLAELLGSLSSSIPSLVRDELELLRAQLRFVLARLQAASVLLVVATALVMAAVILLVGALVTGLAMFLIHVGSEPMAAVALAALLVAVSSGIIAGVLVTGATGELRSAKAAVGQGMNAVVGNRPGESEI